jgi:hypothetical protein
MRINQHNIFTLLQYKSHRAIPNTGRIIVFVPDDYDFTNNEGDGVELITPQNRDTNKVGVIVAVGAELPHLPLSPHCVVGRLCAIPNHPGLLQVEDGYKFMTYPYSDIPFFYPDMAISMDSKEDSFQFATISNDDFLSHTTPEQAKELYEKAKPKLRTEESNFFTKVQHLIHLFEQNSHPTKDDVAWEDQSQGKVWRFNEFFAQMIQQVLHAGSVHDLDLNTETVFLCENNNPT